MRLFTQPYPSKALLWLLLLAACLMALYSQNSIDRMNTTDGNQGELLYFPSARFTKAAAFGFTNLAADGIWLQVIQYYGKHSLSDREYKYLGHMFDLLTYLAPQFRIAYNFGALLLVTDVKDPGGALKLLDKGIRQNPGDWSIPFAKGFINYVFLGDYLEAGRWFTIASHLPDAPEMAGHFAAAAWKRGGAIETSRALWVELYNRSNNPTERDLAQRYIAKIDRELIAGQLQKLAEEFQRRNKRPIDSLHELVAGGLIKRIPEDPLGGRFFWDAKAGKVLAR